MALTDTPSRETFYGNGVTTDWATPFIFWSPIEIQCVRVDLQGVEHPLVYGVDFSVSGGEGKTGSVTYPISGDPLPGDGTEQGSEWLIVNRLLALEQLTRLASQGPYFARNVETALDKNTARIQQQQEQIDRSVKQSLSADGDVIFPNPLASALVGWDTAGENLRNWLVEQLGSVAVTAYTRDWLTSEDAPEGRSKLDAASLGSNNTWRGAQYFDMTSGNAYIQMTSPNAQSMFDQYSGTGTADKRRSRLRQSGNFGAIVGLTDSQVVRHKVMEWNDVGAVRFGDAGGAEGLAGWVNAVEHLTDGRGLLNGHFTGSYAPSGASFRFDDILNAVGQDGRFRAVKIHIPRLRFAAKGAYMGAYLIKYPDQSLEQDNVYIWHSHTTHLTAANGGVSSGDWEINTIPLVAGGLFDANAYGVDFTMWIEHVHNGVKQVWWRVTGTHNTLEEYVLHVGCSQMGVNTDVYHGIQFQCSENVLDGVAEVTYERTV